MGPMKGAAGEEIRMNEFIVHKAEAPDPERAVRGVFGISLDELVADIIRNKNGKYDALYRPVREEKSS